MLDRLRPLWTRMLTPIARMLLNWGITPGMVTWIGTGTSVTVALLCFPQGWLWQGGFGLLAIIASDSLDGLMARLSEQTTQWGAFLDSTLDRIADGAILGGLTLYLAWSEYPRLGAMLGISALVLAEVTSYVKARGEALGKSVSGGLVGRADRLVICLTGALVEGLGLAWALPVAMGILTLGGTITVAQRMTMVHQTTMEWR